ncbi:hypothetical protein ACTVM8_25750, partial [Serratia marcescens]
DTLSALEIVVLYLFGVTKLLHKKSYKTFANNNGRYLGWRRNLEESNPLGRPSAGLKSEFIAHNGARC